MLPTSNQYKEAIVARTRQIVAKALIDLVDPDIQYGAPTSSPLASYADIDQIGDRVLEPSAPRVTLELNKWGLDGRSLIVGADNGQQGFISSALGNGRGELMSECWVQINTRNLSVLQAAAVYFPGGPADGVGQDFRLDIYSGGTLAYSESVTGNGERAYYFEGFSAYDVTAMRLTVTKWSLPYHRARVIELVPGLYEEWDGATIYKLDVIQTADFSGLTIPYGIATMTIRNETRRFDPRNPSGIFESIEERQAIPISLGVVEENGTEFVPLGVYYQRNGGWSIDGSGLTITWKLVDIIGLLAARKYNAPTTLPTTLEGWYASIVAQLGPNFAQRYTLPPDLAETALTCSAGDLSNASCGDLLRWLCQAAGCYPIADPVTGYLSAKKLGEETVNREGLGMQSQYPTISDNTDLAAINYRLGASDQQMMIPGTDSAANQTVSIANPFLKTTEQAATAARYVLVNYGGNRIQTRGRGDPSNEIGDIDAVEILPGVEMTARRYKQQFVFDGGVLKNCGGYFVQATGQKIYTEYEVITQDGPWTVPDGVSKIMLILVGGGSGGYPGTSGTWQTAGTPGAGGVGGKVWYQEIGVNPGGTVDVQIGAGGAPGQPGTDTIFGTAYSSADGERRQEGYAILALGKTYGQAGKDGSQQTQSPPPNSGAGGDGGRGGSRGVIGKDQYGEIYYGAPPGSGGAGTAGGSGVAIIAYDR